MPELVTIVTSLIVPLRWIVNRIVTTPLSPVCSSGIGISSYQCTRILLTIDSAYSPQSYHCVSNDSGPASAVPLSPPTWPRSRPWRPPRDATLPTSRIALRQSTRPFAAAAACCCAGWRYESEALDCGCCCCGCCCPVADGRCAACACCAAALRPPPASECGAYIAWLPSPGRSAGVSPVGCGADAFRFAPESGAFSGAVFTFGPGASVNCCGFWRISS